ncbi:MAG: MBL fold metallo-hydrolase [Bacteroidaceae bacterium]|nr:MBL fold metallo-hydrolase [Bacteroidaceae bacterium]
MQITIHRAEQIGGQITRISTAKGNIIIDLGHILPNSTKNKDVYDDDLAVAEITKGCSAILYTHYHGDHIGLFHHVPNDIPQYIGEVAKQVVCRKYEQLSHLPDEAGKQKYQHALNIASNLHTFHEKQTLHFGDIIVTPYFVSHSAYDAYMFLIEAEGKRILHTGDFRRHGYLSKGLLPTIQKYIGQVDVLIIEGTMLARKNEAILTEAELSRKAAELMKEHKYVFVHCSSTDMERLASFKNATRQMPSHRPLLADKYQKDLLDIFSITAGQKRSSTGKESTCFKFGTIYMYEDRNIKLKNWMISNGFTMFVRSSEKFHSLLDQIFSILPTSERPILIYSMWDGYINREDTKKEDYIRLQKRFATIESLHTSGHATTDVLCRICELVNPRLAILPIHKEKDTDFSSIGIPSHLQKKVITKNHTLSNIDIEFI